MVHFASEVKAKRTIPKVASKAKIYTKNHDIFLYLHFIMCQIRNNKL